MSATEERSNTIPTGPLGDTGIADGPPPSAKAPITGQGTADAPLHILAIQPQDTGFEAVAGLSLGPADVKPSSSGESRYEHLSSDAFVGSERMKSLRPMGPNLRVRVTVADQLVELPHDSPQELRDFVEELFLFDGRVAIDAIRAELRLIVRICEYPDQWEKAMDVPVDAPSGGTPAASDPSFVASNIPGYADARRRYLELRQRLGPAGLADALVWQAAFDDMLTSFNRGLLDLMVKFEEAVSERTRQQLAKQRDSIEVQTANYFQWHYRSSVQAQLESLNGSELQVDDPFVREFRGQLATLKVRAEEFLAADARRRAVDVPGQGGEVPLTPRQEEALEARQRQLNRIRGISDDDDAGLTGRQRRQKRTQAELDAATAALAGALASAGAKHPVFYRFSNSELIEAAEMSAGRLGGEVFRRLQMTWKAARSIQGNLWRQRPASKAKRVGGVTAELAPETIMGRSEWAAKSVWAYPKLVDDGLNAIDPKAADYLRRASANVADAMSAKAADDAGTETLEMVGVMALTLALHMACPPLGFALDIATSTSDIYATTSAFNDQSDEAWCFLNPRDSLVDPPTRWSQAFAVAGAVMVVAL